MSIKFAKDASAFVDRVLVAPPNRKYVGEFARFETIDNSDHRC